MDKEKNFKEEGQKTEKSKEVRSVAWRTFLWSGIASLLLAGTIAAIVSDPFVIDMLAAMATFLLFAVVLIILPLVIANGWSVAIIYKQKSKRNLLFPFLIAAIGIPILVSWALFIFLLFSLRGHPHIGAAGGPVFLLLSMGHITGIINGTVNRIVACRYQERNKSKAEIIISGILSFFVSFLVVCAIVLLYLVTGIIY